MQSNIPPNINKSLKYGYGIDIGVKRVLRFVSEGKSEGAEEESPAPSDPQCQFMHIGSPNVTQFV